MFSGTWKKPRSSPVTIISSKFQKYLNIQQLQSFGIVQVQQQQPVDATNMSQSNLKDDLDTKVSSLEKKYTKFKYKS